SVSPTRALLSFSQRAHPLMPVFCRAGTNTTATPAAAQIVCIGSIISSAVARVRRLSWLSEDDNRLSSNSATSNSFATISVSRTQAAIDCSRALRVRGCRYATAEARHTEFQLSGDDTPKKLRRASASERAAGNENLSF